MVAYCATTRIRKEHFFIIFNIIFILYYVVSFM